MKRKEKQRKKREVQ